MSNVLSKPVNRLCLAAVAVGVVMAGTVLQAKAGDARCTNCYERVVTPPVYGTVPQTVVVQPARTLARIVPAEVRTVMTPVVVRPALTVTRHAGPEYRTVAHQVMVSPPRKVWQVTRDAMGREVGCWVAVPAQYETRHSQVLVRPQRSWLETLPPTYGVEPRQVTVRPQHVVHETIPAVTRVEHRTVVVAPGSDRWRPIGGHHRHRKY